MTQLPIIDLRAPEREVARHIAEACKAHGFFYIVGHEVDEALALRLERLIHWFFALPDLTKAQYAMAVGGSVWRWWFSLGGALTSGRTLCGAQWLGKAGCVWPVGQSLGG